MASNSGANSTAYTVLLIVWMSCIVLNRTWHSLKVLVAMFLSAAFGSVYTVGVMTDEAESTAQDERRGEGSDG
jgi:hypothetical protein